MAEDSERPDGIVTFTDEALLDLAEIDNSTAVLWGPTQADRYIKFLIQNCRQIAENPTNAPRIKRFPDYRCFLCKYSNKRWSHGHRIIYKEVPDGIEIIALIHTASDIETN